MRFFMPALGTVLTSGLVIAHPGEEARRQASGEPRVQREFSSASVARALEACSDQLESSGVWKRAVARRQETVAKSRKRDVPLLNPDIVNDTNHHYLGDITPITPEEIIFGNTTCGLSPEGETGPYYIPGELLRSNVLENEKGVPLLLDAQFIDVSTCAPVAGLYLDFWNCNATGVYSGIIESGNGNDNDTSNANKTFLRGIVQTDYDGVGQIQTLFPGHYSGRTNHIHMVAHVNATVLPNNTLTGGSDAHIGQLFMDQGLIDKVEASWPYRLNTIKQTLNVNDGVFITESEDTTIQPVLEYVYLGNNLDDGLFAWVTVGINVSATYDPNYSFIWTAVGAVADAHGSNTPSPGWSQVGDWD